MTTVYLVDGAGRFLGAFVDFEPADLPAGTEVPSAPPDGAHLWSGSAWVPVVPELEEARSTAIGRVNGEAESLRHSIVTGGAVQALSYTTKHRRAEEVVARIDAGETPLAADYPILSGLIGIEVDPTSGTLATTLQEVAQIVVATGREWEAWEGQIDAVRRQAIIAIEGAADVTAIDQALSAVMWPTIPA